MLNPRAGLFALYVANAKKGEFRAEGSTIYLYDMIVNSDIEAQYFGGVSPEAFIRALSAIKGDVTLRINSPGGDVFAARAMVQAMRDHEGSITAHVDGYAASAASLISSAGDRVIMAEGAFIMIHNAWTFTMGDKAEHGRSQDLLAQIDMSIAETYAARGNRSADEFSGLMDAETWLNPAAAIEAGLADEQVTAADTRAARARWNLAAFAAPPAPQADPPMPEPEPVDSAPLPELQAEKRMRQHRARLAMSTV